MTGYNKYVIEKLDLCISTIIPRIYFRIEEELDNMRKVEHDHKDKISKAVYTFYKCQIYYKSYMLFIP